jgi:hypothetical protein|tara:strand:+ start:3396 stop:3557 length:162 start_codon:yes stop_codon:yes gene_type:complete
LRGQLAAPLSKTKKDKKMPKVGKKKFPYTEKGKKAAKSARKRLRKGSATKKSY